MTKAAQRRKGALPVTEYRLQDIPLDLWRQVKAEAAAAGKTIREYIIETISERIKKEGRNA